MYCQYTLIVFESVLYRAWIACGVPLRLSTLSAGKVWTAGLHVWLLTLQSQPSSSTVAILTSNPRLGSPFQNIFVGYFVFIPPPENKTSGEGRWQPHPGLDGEHILEGKLQPDHEWYLCAPQGGLCDP
jgi:hypothetical protein